MLQALPRSKYWRFVSALAAATSIGARVCDMSMSPACSAFSVAVVSAIGLKVIASRYGPPAAAFQYSAFFVERDVVARDPFLELERAGADGGRRATLGVDVVLEVRIARPCRASRAAGLENVNGVSVRVTRNAEFGASALMTNVVGSGASTDLILPVMTVSM